MNKNEPELIDLDQHVDSRGILNESLRDSWGVMPRLQQVYVVRNREPGTVRAFHAHQELWDGFSIVNGSARFHLFRVDTDFDVVYNSDNVASHIYSNDVEMWDYTLDSRKPQLLVIPPTIFHGWVSLEPNTVMMSLASHEYNHDDPDEVRISPNIVRVNWGADAK